MNPPPAKHNSEQAAVIEKWDQDRNDLMQVDPKCELKDPFILTAFCNLLTPMFRDYINKQMDPTQRKDYALIRERVYSWALKIRLENKKDQVGPMDNLEGAADWPGYDQLTHGHGQGSYWEHGSWGGGCPTIGGEAAAIGQGKGQFAGLPGKGMGKGIKGACWNCGGKGHRASECNQAQKGKGKGKFGAR